MHPQCYRRVIAILVKVSNVCEVRRVVHLMRQQSVEAMSLNGLLINAIIILCAYADSLYFLHSGPALLLTEAQQ